MNALARLVSLVVPLVLAPAAFAQWSYLQEAVVDSTLSFGANCALGNSVDLDGDVAVIGVPTPGAAGSPGHALVFRRNAGVWTQEGDLSASDGATADYFGWSVAVEGDRIVVGAIGKYFQTSPGAGAVYVFRRVQGQWIEEQKLMASDPLQSAQFGWSVGLDGATLVAGAPQALYNNEAGRGAAYVFDFNGASWAQSVKLAGLGTVSGARNGSSVAIDADRIVIGARTTYEDNGQTIGTGSGYVFRRTAGVWSQEAKLQATNYVAWAVLGSSAAIDGDRVVLGAPGENINTGAAYVFQRTGAGWQQKARLTGASTDSGDYFGHSVSVDGARIAVGTPNYDSVTPQGNGAIKLFSFDGAVWSEALELLGSPMTLGDTLGNGCAIQGDLVVGGSPSWNMGLMCRAWMWRLDPPDVASYCVAKVNSLGCTPTIAANGTASATAASGLQILATNVRNQKAGLLIYSVTGRASTPFYGGFLCMQLPVRRTTPTNSGGTQLPASDCTGAYSIDMNTFARGTMPGSHPLAALGVPGTVVDVQFWGVDPGFPAPNNVAMTEGLEYIVCP